VSDDWDVDWAEPPTGLRQWLPALAWLVVFGVGAALVIWFLAEAASFVQFVFEVGGD